MGETKESPVMGGLKGVSSISTVGGCESGSTESSDMSNLARLSALLYPKKKPIEEFPCRPGLGLHHSRFAGAMDFDPCFDGFRQDGAKLLDKFTSQDAFAAVE